MSKIQKVPPPNPPAPRVWTSLDLINWTKDYFAKKEIPSPRLEAELLLSEALGCPRIKLYVDFEKAVAPEQLAKFREWVKRRAESREPAQYIVGHSQFIDLKLKVNKSVLIPRPETEVLAVWALDRAREALPPIPASVPAKQDPPVEGLAKTEVAAPAPVIPTPSDVVEPPAVQLSVLDLCTGSGCVGLYLASKEQRLRVDATDISADALAVAAENVQSLKLENRVTLHRGDLFAALPVKNRGSYDLIVANPPYIDPAAKATLQPEVRDHEPAQALFADDAGLAVIQRLITCASEWLKPGGWLGLEFGMGQADAAKTLAESTNAYGLVEIVPDGNRIPRFLISRRK
jgi:release factor glutamine methyltransferase